jgi:hypothetical protein
MPSATAEGDPPSEHAQDHPDQHGDVAELRDLKQQVKQQAGKLQEQEDKLLQLEKLLLTDHRIARDGSIDDVREDSVVVCARDFGSAQVGLTFVAPGATWPPPVTVSVQPGAMATPMSPGGAFPGFAVTPLQGLNTRQNGTEGRPQTAAAGAASGAKGPDRPPFRWEICDDGSVTFNDEGNDEFRKGTEYTEKRKEMLSTGVLSYLLGPEAPAPKPGNSDTLTLGDLRPAWEGHPDINQDESYDLGLWEYRIYTAMVPTLPRSPWSKETMKVLRAYAEFLGCDTQLAMWGKEVDDTDIYEVLA